MEKVVWPVRGCGRLWCACMLLYLDFPRYATGCSNMRLLVIGKLFCGNGTVWEYHGIEQPISGIWLILWVHRSILLQWVVSLKWIQDWNSDVECWWLRQNVVGWLGHGIETLPTRASMAPPLEMASLHQMCSGAHLYRRLRWDSQSTFGSSFIRARAGPCCDSGRLPLPSRQYITHCPMSKAFREGRVLCKKARRSSISPSDFMKAILACSRFFWNWVISLDSSISADK